MTHKQDCLSHKLHVSAPLCKEIVHRFLVVFSCVVFLHETIKNRISFQLITHTHAHIPYIRDQHCWLIKLAELSSHGSGRSRCHTVVNTCYLFFSLFAQSFKPSVKVCAHKLTKFSCRSETVTQIRMTLFSKT